MRKSIILFSILASMILVTHVIAVHAEDSEARKKAKAREEQFAKDAKDAKIKNLNDQKKALDTKPVVAKIKEPKGKAAAEATNTALQKALNDAETAYNNAKDALDTAKRTLKLDSTNSTKQQNYDNAKKTLAKAEIDLKLVRLGK